MKKTLLYTFLLSTLAASCSRKDPDPVLSSGKVAMRFKNMAGTEPLKFQDAWYRNAHGDSFNVTLFAYYITNIRLNKADGSGAYVQPNSYYLLDGYNRPATMNFDIDSIPDGTYNSITLTIGVDSARNTAGAGTGALDQIWGYYWGWNSGYIFLKFEGYNSAAANAQKLEYHIGGYQGSDATMRTVTLSLPAPVQIARGKTATVEVEADVLKLFDAPNQIDFTQLHMIHDPGSQAKAMADNYAGMLRVKTATVK